MHRGNWDLCITMELESPKTTARLLSAIKKLLIMAMSKLNALTDWPRFFSKVQEWSGQSNNHPETQNDIGGYYYGEGVVQDYSEAVKWFQLAAQEGYGYVILAVCT